MAASTRWPEARLEQERGRFWEKAAQKLFESGPTPLNMPTPIAQIQKSLFASFSSEKEVLACCFLNLNNHDLIQSGFQRRLEITAAVALRRRQVAGADV
jgi:hypothetical protein